MIDVYFLLSLLYFKKSVQHISFYLPDQFHYFSFFIATRNRASGVGGNFYGNL